MPRDLMHQGPRPPRLRSAREFDELFALMELDAEAKAEAEKPESGDLPMFEMP